MRYEKLSEDGIYEIYCIWKGGNRSAHVFCAEVTEGKIKLFDPQNGDGNVSRYLNAMSPSSISVLRVDNKIVNPKIHGLFLKST